MSCPLSPAELAVITGLARGLKYKDIARERGIGESTARSHMYAACRRLGVRDRSYAVLCAWRRGWIDETMIAPVPPDPPAPPPPPPPAPRKRREFSIEYRLYLLAVQTLAGISDQQERRAMRLVVERARVMAGLPTGQHRASPGLRATRKAIAAQALFGS